MSGKAFEEISKMIKDTIKCGSRCLPHLVALIPYLYFETMYWSTLGQSIHDKDSKASLSEYVAKVKEFNVKYTLWTAFNKMVAEDIYRKLEEKIHKPLDEIKSSVEINSIVQAINRARKRVLKRAKDLILMNVEKRLNAAYTSERRRLNAASLILTLELRNIRIASEITRIEVKDQDYIIIELQRQGGLSKAVASFLGEQVSDVEDLFYKYLLGFRADTYTIYGSTMEYSYRLAILRYLKPVVIKLASEAFQYENVIRALATQAFECEEIKECKPYFRNLCLDFYIQASLTDSGSKHEDKLLKQFLNKILTLRKKGKSNFTYYELSRQELADIQIRVVDRLTDRLIRRGLAQARYVGPASKDLPKECRGVGYSKDPWLRDRARSGEIKLWLIAYTRNKELRSRRRRCWEQYIVIDFTKFFNEFERLCGIGLTQLINAIANQDKASQTQ
jgi:hypothetical protein